MDESIAAMAAFWEAMRDKPDNEINAALRWLNDRFDAHMRDRRTTAPVCCQRCNDPVRPGTNLCATCADVTGP